MSLYFDSIIQNWFNCDVFDGWELFIIVAIRKLPSFHLISKNNDNFYKIVLLIYLIQLIAVEYSLYFDSHDIIILILFLLALYMSILGTVTVLSSLNFNLMLSIKFVSSCYFCMSFFVLSSNNFILLKLLMLNQLQMFISN